MQISNGPYNDYPAVSFDGKMLAYSNDDLSGRNGVEVISLDGLRDNVGKSFILILNNLNSIRGLISVK